MASSMFAANVGVGAHVPPACRRIETSIISSTVMSSRKKCQISVADCKNVYYRRLLVYFDALFGAFRSVVYDGKGKNETPLDWLK